MFLHFCRHEFWEAGIVYPIDLEITGIFYRNWSNNFKSREELTSSVLEKKCFDIFLQDLRNFLIDCTAFPLMQLSKFHQYVLKTVEVIPNLNCQHSNFTGFIVLIENSMKDIKDVSQSLVVRVMRM